MKFIVAADSFKGSLSSREVGEAAEKGIIDALPDADVMVFSIADGGEGTVGAITEALGGDRISTIVTGPLGEKVEAVYGICGDTAVMEIAAACGLTLINPSRRNPELATSFGVGEMIHDALRRGCRKFLVGLGGSATNDAGTGMLQALGFRFLDEDGVEIGRGANHMGRIAQIDESGVTPLLRNAEFTVACDVTNPLTGPRGASRVFGQQKGATASMIERLDDSLTKFATIVARHYKRGLEGAPGSGAAGGLGYAFISFLGASLRPGIEMVLDAIRFDSHLTGASLVITGEGRLDSQTLMGKAPFGVMRRAAAGGIPVIAIGGAVDTEATGELLSAGFASVFPIVQGPCSLADAMRQDTTRSNIRQTVSMIIRSMLLPGFGQSVIDAD